MQYDRGLDINAHVKDALWYYFKVEHDLTWLNQLH